MDVLGAIDATISLCTTCHGIYQKVKHLLTLETEHEELFAELKHIKELLSDLEEQKDNKKYRGNFILHFRSYKPDLMSQLNTDIKLSFFFKFTLSGVSTLERWKITKHA